MVAGANKVFCGTENGVCELTKDTVYVHPSAKQCSWTPSSTGSPFTQVATFGSGEYINFTISNITNVGMYYLHWRFNLASTKYMNNVLVASMYVNNRNYDCYVHSVGLAGNTSFTNDISVWINVTYRTQYGLGMTIDGKGIESNGYDAFESISLGLAVSSTELYNGNSYRTVSATLYRLSPS